MQNGDLKRFYAITEYDGKDFVRLNKDGKVDKSVIPDDIGTEVVANPTGTATSDLEKLKVGETIYGIPEGTNVVANPTLAGTESALTGLEVGSTKYKVDSGMANPMTTQGDIIYGGSSGTPTRLAKPSSTEYGTYQFLNNGTAGAVQWSGIQPTMLYKQQGNQYNCLYAYSNNAGEFIDFGRPARDFGLGIYTTAPTADNTDGGIRFVVLTSEPATYYDGYYYIIAPTPTT